MARDSNVQNVSSAGEQRQLEFPQPSQQRINEASHVVRPKGGVVVRHKECKTILNRTNISDYSLNCYTGCAHGCVYCYARFMQRFSAHPEPWGRFVDVKVNAVETLKRQLRRAAAGEVFVSSACDGWQPVEAEWKLTRRCCQLLLEHGFDVHILTKSRLVLRDLDVFSGASARIGVTVTTLDERLRKLWEPKGSSTRERFRIIEQAHRAELRTAIMFGPLLPFLSDSQSSIDSMFARAAELGVDIIWVDTLNPRPKVWPSVASLLHERFPDLLDRYRQILFDKTIRAKYLEHLRQRVAEAARRSFLANRVIECF